jgi:transcriptional regulator of arginine metabolism
MGPDRGASLGRMASLDLPSRLEALRQLLLSERASTQDELREQMGKLGFAVNQSTISRDLRRLGAIKIADANGRVVYRLPMDGVGAPPPAASVKSLGDLVRSVRHNGFLAVLLTDPGSASLLARHIDGLQSNLILGTIAGDDAIFVAPASARHIEEMVREIEASLGTAWFSR